MRAQLDDETTDAGRAEVLSQLARVAALRGDFDAADRLLDEAVPLAGDDAVAGARLALERGRTRRSSGDPDAARPLFDAAFAAATGAGQTFIAADAAHMAALVAPGRDGFVAWTERGIELAGRDEDARSWLGPLYNNIGWEYYEAGEFEEALTAFRQGLAVREEASEEEQPVEIARYAVGKALRALGRSDEAVPLLERAVAWATAAGAPDGWFHEELALEYAALGRDTDAAVQARAAMPLLERDDPDFAPDGERIAELRKIAASRVAALATVPAQP